MSTASKNAFLVRTLSSYFARVTHPHYLDDLKDINAGSPSDEQVLAWDDGTSMWIPMSVGTSGLGAPDNAQYLVLSYSVDLSDERLLTPGDGISGADGGAGSTYTIAVDLATTSGLQFSSGELLIGAGDGIDVLTNTIAVDVTDIIDTNYGLTESSNNIQINLAATSGLNFLTGALRVGAGDGIDVLTSTIAVDVTDIIDTNYGLTEDTNNIRINLAATSGLNFSGGALLVGAGDGIDVLTNTIAVDVTDFIDTSYGLTESSNNIRINLATNSGLQFATGALQMGTPTTIDLTTTDSVTTTTHAHDITTSSDVSAPEAAILSSTSSGGLTLATLDVEGNLTVTEGGDFTVGANIFFVDASEANVGINCDPDDQFDLDVLGSIRAQGWFVGSHAIQLADAYHIWHFDGLPPLETDFYGTALSHMGLQPSTETNITFVPGKFNKSIFVTPATTNFIVNPVGDHPSDWDYGWNSVSLASSGVTLADPVYGEHCFYFTASANGGQMNTTVTGLSGSATYSVSVYVKSTSSSVGLRVYTPTLGTLATVYHSGDGEWELLTYVVTLDAADTQVTVRIIDTRASGWDEVRFDAVMFTTRDWPVPFLYGDMPNASWNGNEHESTSLHGNSALEYTVDIPRKFTVGLWMKTPWISTQANSVSPNWGRAVVWYYNGSNMFRFIHHGTANYLYLNWLRGGAADANVNLGAVADREWHQYVFSYDGEKIYCYVDGILINTGGNTVTDWADAEWPSKLRIGEQYNGGNEIDAWIDDIWTAERALDDDEIRAIYESDAPVFAETSTFTFEMPGATPIWVDQEGFWMLDSTGDPVFGWSIVDSKSWGGTTLDAGDNLVGQYGAAEGGWQWWDRSAAQFMLGYADVTVWQFDSGGATLNGVLDISTTGGIYQGSGSFAAPTTGLKLWAEDSGGTYYGRIGGYNASTPQWYADTDGKLYAGGGDVVLDASGITISAVGSWNEVRWSDGTDNYAEIKSYSSVNATFLDLESYSDFGSMTASNVWVRAFRDSTYNSLVDMQASSSAARIWLLVTEAGTQRGIRLTSSEFDVDSGVLLDVNEATRTDALIVGTSLTTYYDDDAVIEGGLRVGNLSTDPISGQITASGHIKTAQGMMAGSTTIVPDTGDIWCTNDGRFGGGIAIGYIYSDPAASEIIFYNDTNLYRSTNDTLKTDDMFLAVGDIRTSGGLGAGSLTNDPGAGEVWATADARIGGGLYVGSTATDPDPDDIYYDGDLRPSRSGTAYTGYIFVPVTPFALYHNGSSNSWGGITLTAGGTFLFDLQSAENGLPADIKAVYMTVYVKAGATVGSSPDANFAWFRAKGATSGGMIMRYNHASLGRDYQAIVQVGTDNDIECRVERYDTSVNWPYLWVSIEGYFI